MDITCIAHLWVTFLIMNVLSITFLLKFLTLQECELTKHVEVLSAELDQDAAALCPTPVSYRILPSYLGSHWVLCKYPLSYISNCTILTSLS